MGGTAYIQDGLQPNRFVHPTSRVGFHAPDPIIAGMRDMQNGLINFDLYAEPAYCGAREGSALTFIDLARDAEMTLAPNTLQAPGWARYPGPLPISEVFPGTMIDLLQIR